MLKSIEEQIRFGKVAIQSIKFYLKSRDDIVQILIVLQYLYCDETHREEMFALLDQIIPSHVSREHGRLGMHLWQILVLGVLRLNLNCDSVHRFPLELLTMSIACRSASRASKPTKMSRAKWENAILESTNLTAHVSFRSAMSHTGRWNQ